MTNDHGPHRQMGAEPGASSAQQKSQGIRTPIALPRPRRARARLPLQPSTQPLSPAAVEAIEAAGSYDTWWRSCVDRAIVELAKLGRPFSVDDVRDQGIAEPERPQQWGAPFMAARRAGIIRPLAVIASTRPTRHGGLTRQWIGTTETVGHRAGKG